MSQLRIAVVGAGHLGRIHAKLLGQVEGADLVAISDPFEAARQHAAELFSVPTYADFRDCIAKVDAAVIAAPTDAHADIAGEFLKAGKHVFLEKPLALHREEITEVERSLDDHPDRMLMIGFNRRFSPHMKEMRRWLGSTPGSKSVILTVNAGAIPPDHWSQKREVGGGRIVGEGCHFIDLARFLVGSPIVSSTAFPMSGGDGRLGDCVSMQLTFADGSIATIHYLANGSKDFPKERVEVFAGGRVLICDNFRSSREVGGKRRMKTRQQDKGHAAELMAFIDTIRIGGSWPIPRAELLEVSEVAIDLQAVTTN